jgi:hypothetical protein
MATAGPLFLLCYKKKLSESKRAGKTVLYWAHSNRSPILNYLAHETNEARPRLFAGEEAEQEKLAAVVLA